MRRGVKLAIATAIVVASVTGLFAPALGVAAAQTVGMVTKAQNQVQISGQAVAVGSPVGLNDTLQTGANARLQVTFRDNTTLTLGENATVVVDRFVFDPDASVGEATLNATKGALRMVTGRISDMTNKDIKVKTSFGAARFAAPISGRDRSMGKTVCCWCTTADLRYKVTNVPRAQSVTEAVVAAP